MSPRSAEFMLAARERLAGARDALAADHPGLAASAAYYAMLYAARAALSERERYAKTHSGTWSLFSEAFVVAGRFSHELFREATAAQKTRELGDYEARPPSGPEASAIVEAADRFVDAVAAMVGE